MNDLTKDQKVEKRKEKKELNLKLSNILDTSTVNITDKTKKRISDCGSFLEFLSDKDFENYKLSNANFCGNRFCPHCAFNLSRKNALKFEIILKYLKQKFGYNFLFITFTAPNVRGDFLKNELDSYYRSFNRLIKRKRFVAISKGFIRKFEITYNRNRDDYHPHYHVLIAVNPSYFTDSSLYISRNEWLRLWQECKRDFSITQVDVRKMEEDNFKKSIFELSKYLSKDSDYLYDDKVFEVFYKNLKGRRFLGYSGVFSDVNELYKNGDLDYLKDKDLIEYVYKVFYIWKNFDYSIDSVLELSEFEKSKYNFDLKDNLEDFDLDF